MKRCTLCGELSDGTINIYSSYRDVQVVNLIEVYTHLRVSEIFPCISAIFIVKFHSRLAGYALNSAAIIAL